MSIRDNIKAFIDARGPDVVTRSITVSVGDLTSTNDWQFRVLPYLEVDKLRTRFIGKEGADPDRIVGNNARWVTACVVDDGGGSFDYNDVITWPTALIDALAKAAGDVNAQNKKPEDVAKN